MERLQRRLARVLLTLPLYFLTMVLLHEAGHAITASHATSGLVRIYFWPGYELYPDFGYALPGAWPADRAPAFITVSPVAPTQVADGKHSVLPLVVNKQDFFELQRHASLIALMGAATTSLCALVSLALISLCKPAGVVLKVLAAGALLHLDMLAYTILPVVFGVRHLIWIGGALPEPVEALDGLGIPEGISVTAIVLLSLLQLGWLYYLLRFKLRRPAQVT